MGKIIGVLSLKGGVGKTSVVCALGEALASRGKRVLLIDANFSAPNLGLHLDIDHEISIQDVLRNESNVHDSIYGLGDFDIIPASVFYNYQINPMKLKDKIKYLKKKYDFIILDSSPSLNEETLAVMLASDELFVVSTPDIPTLGMTIKAVNHAKKRDVSIRGLILNKVYNKNFELSLKDIEETSEVPVFAVIPHDVSALKSVSQGKPLTRLKPSSNASKEYKRLAASLSGEKYKGFGLRDWVRRINPKKQDVNRVRFYDKVFK